MGKVEKGVLAKNVWVDHNFWSALALDPGRNGGKKTKEQDFLFAMF